MPILAINTTAAKEHVPEVKRKIRLIKERGRGILNNLLFKKMPRLMLTELVYHLVLRLNAFPANSRVSQTLSPHEIVYQHKLDFAKHCKSPFGAYCEVHDERIAIDCRIVIAGKVQDAPPSVLRAQDCSREGIQIRIRALSG